MWYKNNQINIGDEKGAVYNIYLPNHGKMKGSVESGDECFNSLKRSKVKKVFSLCNKALRLTFNSCNSPKVKEVF